MKINNNNKSSTDNKVNSTSSPPTSKETVFIFAYSMIKRLNGFLLTWKLNHKCLVKIRPFKSAKVRCMQHHVEPTVWNSDQDHIILQCGTNDMNSEKRFSQIAKEIIELALSVNPYKFLYTKIINNQDNITKQVFRKTFKLLMHWSSRVPKQYKQSAIIGDLCISKRIPSNF